MSDKWITEAANGYGNTIRTTRKLVSRQTPYQLIELYETEKMGHLLMLDGIIQLTSYDEFAYHEMMANLPFYAHPAPERALVIGGGDGGVLRELGKHPELKTMDICEIDAAVIETAREFLPETACGFDDPRVRINIADGSVFIREHQQEYDIIIVDSTDPGGPGAPLFGSEFYRNLKGALRPGGVIATQSESPWLLPDVVRNLNRAAKAVFKNVAYSMFYVPTYPTGTIGACVASDGRDVRIPAADVPAELAGKLQYYTTAIHRASFELPAFAEAVLAKED